MKINNKKILLVGGSGFIGHNLALFLKKKETIPIIVDSLSINNLYFIEFYFLNYLFFYLYLQKDMRIYRYKDI